MPNGIVSPAQFQLTPDIGTAITRGLTNVQQLQGIQQRQQDEQVRQLTGQILSGGPGSEQAQQQLRAQFPQQAIQFENLQRQNRLAGFQALNDQQQAELTNFTRRIAQFQTLPEAQQQPFLQREIEKGTAAGIDMSDTQEFLDILQTDPIAAQQRAQRTIGLGQQLGIIGAVKPAVSAKDIQSQVNVLRKDISNVSKSFRQIDEASKRIEAVGRKATAASDISLIFNFMKINDPGSTVREGEFATAQNAAGVPERITNLYNQMLRGTRLSPEQREDFLAQAGNLAEAQRIATDDQIENILQQADQDQIARERVLGEARLEALRERQSRRQRQQTIETGTPASNLSQMSLEELEAERRRLLGVQ